MKKFDKLVIQSFMGPYLFSFFVAEFVLVMQFLWKYIDEILGKGFSLIELLELILYFAVTQIPMALPIAILISSVMVFGNMSEKHELSSMKSAGVSLLRIMRPGILLALFTAFVSLLASNYLKPQANFKFQKRFRAIQAQKPSLTIEEKIFNKDFRGFAIRVDKKGEDGESIDGVLVYDHTKNDKSLINFIKSDSGRMYNSSDGNHFVMELYSGTQYNELKRKRSKKENRKKYPFIRTDFEMWKKSFDLGEFDTDDNGIRINRNKEDMLNTFQLLQSIDSVKQKKVNIIENLWWPKAKKRKATSNKTLSSKTETSRKNKKDNVHKTVSVISPQKRNGRNSSLKNRNSNRFEKVDKFEFEKVGNDTSLVSVVQMFNKKDRKKYLTKALTASKKFSDRLKVTAAQLIANDRKTNKYILRLNQMYAFAAICIIFMFIGGPLGSIIRKGGYGYPLLTAILFYMVFIIMTIMGEKLVRSGQMNPILAAWFSNLLVLPVAAILTFMALRDKKLTNFSLKAIFHKNTSK